MDEEDKQFIRDMAAPLGDLRIIQKDIETHTKKLAEHEDKLAELDKQMAINSMILKVIQWLSMTVLGTGIVIFMNHLLRFWE